MQDARTFAPDAQDAAARAAFYLDNPGAAAALDRYARLDDVARVTAGIARTDPAIPALYRAAMSATMDAADAALLARSLYPPAARRLP